MSASGPAFEKRIAGTKEAWLGTNVHVSGTAGSHSPWSLMTEEKGDNLERGVIVGRSLLIFLSKQTENLKNMCYSEFNTQLFIFF